MKGWKNWQKNAYLEAHDKIKKALIENNGLRKIEIQRATGQSRVTINKHLREFVDVTKEAVKIASCYYWRASIMDLKKDALLIEKLADGVQLLKPIIDKMQFPKKLWRFRQEGTVPLPKCYPVNTDPNAPARIDVMTDKQLREYLEDNREFFERREKVFGGLRRVFFDLAKIIMIGDFGATTAEDDLSNDRFVVEIKGQFGSCCLVPPEKG